MTEETNKASKKSATVIQVENISGGGYAFLLVFLFWWLSGIVLAKGFWSAFFSIIFFPYGLYLVVERILLMAGVT